jgi:hypothetical protein
VRRSIILDETQQTNQSPRRKVSMKIPHQKIENLLSLVRKLIPDWDNFLHPKFVEEEVAYKQEATLKAQHLLGKEELERLLSQGQSEEIILRLEKVGRSTNLLFMGVPRQGDLNILYQPAIDKETFSRAVFDLLYGSGDTPLRLDRFISYVEKSGLPNKWTFPTYLLFLCFPASEMFVKPRTMKWILEFLDLGLLWDKTPGGKAYAGIRQAMYDLRDALQIYHPRDMIDLQGLTWMAFRAASGEDQGNRSSEEEIFSTESLAPLAPPFSQIFASRTEAEWAFDLLRMTSDKLGIYPDHHLATYTVRRGGGGYRLRLSFGNWLIIGFAGNHGRLNEVVLALPDDYIGANAKEKQSFAQPDGEQKISLYFFSPPEILPLPDHLHEAFDRSLALIAARFENWQGSPHHHNSNPTVTKAVFDNEQRDKLLGKWLRQAIDEYPEAPDPVINPNLLSARKPSYYWKVCARTRQAASIWRTKISIKCMWNCPSRI